MTFRNPAYLTTTESAAILGVSRVQVWRLCWLGRLPGARQLRCGVWAIPRTAAETYVPRPVGWHGQEAHS